MKLEVEKIYVTHHDHDMRICACSADPQSGFPYMGVTMDGVVHWYREDGTTPSGREWAIVRERSAEPVHVEVDKWYRTSQGALYHIVGQSADPTFRFKGEGAYNDYNFAEDGTSKWSVRLVEETTPRDRTFVVNCFIAGITFRVKAISAEAAQAKVSEGWHVQVDAPEITLIDVDNQGMNARETP